MAGSLSDLVGTAASTPTDGELVAQADLLPGGFTVEELASLRAEFPILADTTYLISGSLGAMPVGVASELANFAHAWATRGVRAWGEGWWETSITTGDLLAPILGLAAGGQVAMHQNASVAAAVFLSALDYPTDRRKVIATGLDFPSLHYVLAGEARKGAEIVMFPGDDDGVGLDLEGLLGAIDRSTRLVAVSHALFRSSYLLDAAAIARRCREVGALLLLDVYQTAGIVPLELAAWGVDAAVGGGVKWLCAGPGNGFLWVRPDLLAELRPTVTGWQADRQPFAFNPGELEPAEGAWRLLTGTPNVPAHVAARPGLRFVGGLGVERIRARSLGLTSLIIDLLDQVPKRLGLTLASPRGVAQRAGMVTVRHPAAEQIGRAMMAHEVIVDVRPALAPSALTTGRSATAAMPGIRLAPHVYNTEDECARAVATLAELTERLTVMR